MQLPAARMERVALLLSSLLPATGNAVTAARMARHFERAGYRVNAIDVGEASREEVSVACQAATVVVAVHAYRAGRLLPDAAVVPVVVVLGGTDVNQAAAWEAELEIRAVLRATLARAARVVAFTPDMAERYGGMSARLGVSPPPAVEVIPQGVDDCAEGPCDVDDSLRTLLGIPAADGVLLLVAGLRAVKAPLLLAPAVAARNAAAAKAPTALRPLHLVMIGPLLDPSYAPLVVAATGCDPSLFRPAAVAAVGAGPRLKQGSYGTTIDSPDRDGALDRLCSTADAGEVSTAAPLHRFGGREGVWYHPPVPRAQLLSWLRAESLLGDPLLANEGASLRSEQGITALVNCSESEGQCNALLEAMHAGVPVLARDNPGNASIIQHGVTGWLWHDIDECMRLAEELCFDASSQAMPLAVSDAGDIRRLQVGSNPLSWHDASEDNRIVLPDARYRSTSNGLAGSYESSAASGRRVSPGHEISRLPVAGPQGLPAPSPPAADSDALALALAPCDASGGDEHARSLRQLRRSVAHTSVAARRYVAERHSAEDEAVAWSSLLRTLPT